MSAARQAGRRCRRSRRAPRRSTSGTTAAANADHVSVLAGLQPVRGLALTGSARVGKIVAAPAIAADTTQKISDYEAAIGWERERLGLRVGLSHTAAFSPFGYAEFPRVAAIGPSADVGLADGYTPDWRRCGG